LTEEKPSEAERPATSTIDSIAGLGLESDYVWGGEDLAEALRRRADVSSGR
jgi:hypothetical protein